MRSLAEPRAPQAAGAPAGQAQSTAPVPWWLPLLMLASGFAGLGYQIVWTRQSALWLGHEHAAVLAVVAAFFGGLALGAFALGARIERSLRPARWYAACEVLIALWAAVLWWGLAPASQALVQAAGPEPGPLRQWWLAFGGSFVLLLPATAAMGATLPALAGLVAGQGRRGSAIAGLYAANTLGAVAGVLATAFWLLPAFGLARTAAACAALNLVCAAAALALPVAVPHAATPLPARAPAWRLRALLVATGLLGIGYEVLVLRVLGQVFENTVYTFALVLAVYLAGTALGAAGHQRRTARLGHDAGRREQLLLALAGAVGLGLAALWSAAALRAAAQQALLSWAVEPMTAALLAEAGVALLAFGPPTLVMGALFGQLCDEARGSGLGFGRALGWNTLGAAAAPLVFGVLALPLGGAKAAVLAVPAAYLLLLARRSWRQPVPWVLAGGTATLVVLAPPLVLVDVPAGGRLLALHTGASATASVVEDRQGVRSLHIDNRAQEGSSATRFADGRQALLPLLLHPQPQRALFLGVGTGVTAATAASLATGAGLVVDAVELVPEVLQALPLFVPAPSPSLRLHVADARRFVRAGTAAWDVVVADNFHPARSGSGAQYTVEHFAAVRARLAPGGLFCQWLPLHQLDTATLRSIVRSFQAVYPDARALLATHSLRTPVLGLVGQAGPGGFDPQALQRALAAAGRPGQPDGPAGFGLGDPLALLGSFVAGPASLARFAAGAPLNTDDHPVVAHLAPRSVYTPQPSPQDRLLAWVAQFAIAPHELLQAPADPALSARLGAYLAARDRFLAAGRGVRPQPDVRVMLAQVQGPLLDVLRTSPDFQPALQPLLEMAAALGAADPAAARRLLLELAAVVPDSGAVAQALAAGPAAYTATAAPPR
ncbi:spermidine synthase [Rubrivivax sp. RP6-9]|uniref:spermidine synthase n=1 Tax=Rubrivivax sp. RP6-9 TaxID=3415750 RepID=UPI003CC59715